MRVIDNSYTPNLYFVSKPADYRGGRTVVTKTARTINRIDLVVPTARIIRDIIGIIISIIIGGFEEPAIMT